eukprot:105018-Chlamydomonas_euryale.AAC.1
MRRYTSLTVPTDLMALVPTWADAPPATGAPDALGLRQLLLDRPVAFDHEMCAAPAGGVGGGPEAVSGRGGGGMQYSVRVVLAHGLDVSTISDLVKGEGLALPHVLRFIAARVTADGGKRAVLQVRGWGGARACSAVGGKRAALQVRGTRVYLTAGGKRAVLQVQRKCVSAAALQVRGT